MKLFLWWFDRVIKTKGWWILPCQPHTGKIIFIPLNEVTLRGWGLARRNTQTGVFFPVQQEVKQKSLLLSYINFSSLQSVDRDARISTLRGTGRNPHSWEGGREKRFQISHEKNPQKSGLLLAFLVGSAWQEPKNPFPEWWRLWVSCKNQTLSNRKVSNVLSLKKKKK